MVPIQAAPIGDVGIADEVAHRLGRLTGGGPPATLHELASAWGGQLRARWREVLLSEKATAHSVEVAGRTYPVNCALDGLLLPRLADRDGTLTTEDPTTGQTMSVQISRSGAHGSSHPWAVLSLGVAGGSDDVHECACPHINLFVDRPSFEQWTQRNPSVAAMPLTLAEALPLADRLASDGTPIPLD